jgi:hypothetical protein
VRFLFELAGEPDLESKSYRWVLVEEVAALPEESLSRLAKKLVSQKTPDP